MAKSQKTSSVYPTQIIPTFGITLSSEQILNNLKEVTTLVKQFVQMSIQQSPQKLFYLLKMADFTLGTMVFVYLFLIIIQSLGMLHGKLIRLLLDFFLFGFSQMNIPMVASVIMRKIKQIQRLMNRVFHLNKYKQNQL